jgi:hypothetical protein
VSPTSSSAELSGAARSGKDPHTTSSWCSAHLVGPEFRATCSPHVGTGVFFAPVRRLARLGRRFHGAKGNCLQASVAIPGSGSPGSTDAVGAGDPGGNIEFWWASPASVRAPGAVTLASRVHPSRRLCARTCPESLPGASHRPRPRSRPRREVGSHGCGHARHCGVVDRTLTTCTHLTCTSLVEEHMSFHAVGVWPGSRSADHLERGWRRGHCPPPARRCSRGGRRRLPGFCRQPHLARVVQDTISLGNGLVVVGEVILNRVGEPIDEDLPAAWVNLEAVTVARDLDASIPRLTGRTAPARFPRRGRAR